MKKLYLVIVTMCMMSITFANIELSDFEASQIIGGGTQNSCGDDSFDCPYQALDETSCWSGAFFCREWTSWDKCKQICDDDPCVESTVAYCTKYKVGNAEWVTILSHSYCSYTVLYTNNCDNNGFPKTTCE